MRKQKQASFEAAVFLATRNVRPTKPRGKPMSVNLTDAGRRAGLLAMHAAQRCCAKRRNGAPCRAAALRGAKRCIAHGGRVEVPDHPHNIRRIIAGSAARVETSRDQFAANRYIFLAMTLAERRELAEIVSERTLRRPARLYLAAQIWVDVRGRDQSAVQAFVDQFVRA